MKKYFLVFLVLLIVLSFAGCKPKQFAVGVEKDAVFFHQASSMPEILFREGGNTTIPEKPFLEKLKAAIDGKTPVYEVCNCIPFCHVSIGSYTFSIHTHAIEIFTVTDKGETDRMSSVGCTKAELQELLDILEEAKK